MLLQSRSCLFRSSRGTAQQVPCLWTGHVRWVNPKGCTLVHAEAIVQSGCCLNAMAWCCAPASGHCAESHPPQINSEACPPVGVHLAALQACYDLIAILKACLQLVHLRPEAFILPEDGVHAPVAAAAEHTPVRSLKHSAQCVKEVTQAPLPGIGKLTTAASQVRSALTVAVAQSTGPGHRLDVSRPGQDNFFPPTHPAGDLARGSAAPMSSAVASCCRRRLMLSACAAISP